MGKFTRQLFIIFGLLLVAFGVGIIINPTIYHSGLRYSFDFTEIKWPFGIFIIGLGITFVVTAFRRQAIEYEKIQAGLEKVLMCPACVEPHKKKDAPELKCPACNGDLEDLVGFYERHPELKIV